MSVVPGCASPGALCAVVEALLTTNTTRIRPQAAFSSISCRAYGGPVWRALSSDDCTVL
jgi:hypothetical protein